MHLSAPAAFFACIRRPVGVLVALIVGLACTLLWLMALSAPGMGGTADTRDTVAEPGVSIAVGLRDMSATAVQAPAGAADLARDLGSAMTSMCDSTCVSDLTDTCALAAGLLLMTVMALLVGSRRDTFLGLVARLRRATPVPPPRWLTPWTSPSLSQLGVLRV